MSEELWDIYGGVQEKAVDGTPIGDSTNLPAGWHEFQESLWETITFQRNLDFRPSRQDSVGLSLALQCSDVKARDIAKSEMQLWRRQGRQWTLVEPGEHWFARLLARRPNEFHTWDEFWRMVVIHLDFAQSSYILKNINRFGEVLELIPLPTGRVRPLVSNSGRLFYEVNAHTEFDRAQIRAETVTVPAERMVHLKGRMYDGLNGLSNTSLGEGLFGLLGNISRYQTNLFGNDGRVPIVFESDTAFATGELADAAFRRLKDQLREAVRKMNAYGDPILLEAGYKAKVVAQNAREAMTNEAFEAVVRRVCGLMNMMPHKIFAYEGVKYDNQASADQQYYQQCLQPITTAIQNRFKYDLLSEDEWYDFSPEFDQGPLMAGDAATMVKVLHQALADGALEINEYRERLPLGLNPINGGDVRYVPVNMAMVDRDGNIIQQAADGQPNNDGETARPRLAVDNT